MGNYVVRMRPTKNGVGAVVLHNDSQLARLDGTDPDELWQRALAEAARLNPSFFGYDGAVDRVLTFFPKGFQDPGYAAHEREYKVKAKTTLDVSAPLDLIGGDPAQHTEALVAAYRATNLLSPYEKTWIVGGLRSEKGPAIVEAAANFTLAPSAPTLKAFEQALTPFGAAKWTVATYLPYLWLPAQHMFLKPEVTKNFAERVGHRFADDYEAALRFEVYQSLLDLTSETRAKIAKMNPADNIDIQSFIWIAGAYDSEIDPQH